MERATKLTSKQDGSPFWQIDLDDDGDWRVLANTDAGLGFWYFEDTGQAVEDVYVQWQQEAL